MSRGLVSDYNYLISYTAFLRICSKKYFRTLSHTLEAIVLPKLMVVDHTHELQLPL